MNFNASVLTTQSPNHNKVMKTLQYPKSTLMVYFNKISSATVDNEIYHVLRAFLANILNAKTNEI